MQVRHGEKLGSVLVDADPSDAGSKRQPRKAAKKVASSNVGATADSPATTSENPPGDADNSPQPPPAAPPAPPAEPAKKAPAKAAPAKGTFKSALNK